MIEIHLAIKEQRSANLLRNFQALATCMRRIHLGLNQDTPIYEDIQICIASPLLFSSQRRLG